MDEDVGDKFPETCGYIESSNASDAGIQYREKPKLDSHDDNRLVGAFNLLKDD
jgi:hypothetical protein